jgi:HEPN domain-containing protein
MERLNPFHKMARAYIRQAQDRLEDAGGAVEKGNYPYATRLCQECVELSLKACLRLVGIDYPKVHDPSDILIEYRDRFPPWFRDEVDFMASVSKRLCAKREISFYGGEEAMLSPEELVSREDAVEAVNAASRILNVARRLLETSQSYPR